MSSEPQVYFDGRFVPASAAAVPLSDAGFVLGATVTEQLRTFGGELFRVEEHFARLQHSLQIVGIEPRESPAELMAAARRLAELNHPLLPQGSDLGLAVFVTPGPYRPIAGTGGEPLVGMHTFPLAFGYWARAYRQGQPLVTTDVIQVPRECWPAEVKCRSRMHYYLADRQAAARQPGARALLLNTAGEVAETSTANIVIYRQGEGLIGPPRGTVLPGVSLHATVDLAARLGIPYREHPLRPDDVATAEEVLLTSTPYCILPVTLFNEQPIGTGQVGPMFARLLAAWNNHVRLDIEAQAAEFAT